MTTTTETIVAPCQACGVATSERITPRQELTPAGFTTGAPYGVGLCDDCVTLDFDQPGAAVRAALRLLGKSEADDKLAAEAFIEADVDVSRLLYDAKVRREPQRKAWEHVPRDLKADLRKAYVRVLDAKVHSATDHDRPIPPHSPPDDMPQACLACGIGKSVQWHGPLHTYGLARGPELVTGCVCDTCVVSLVAVGAVGAPFIEKACMAAKGLDWNEAVRIPKLKAWIATGLPPSDEPWSWIGKILPPEPELPPLQRLENRVADLEAEVAALKARLP